MNTLRLAATLSMLLGALPASPVDAGKVYELLKKGSALSEKESAQLEQRLQGKPADEQARIQLLSYYASPRPQLAADAIKPARLRHILWLVEHDPKDGFGLFQIATRVYHINCRGDKLADADGYKQVNQLWLEQVRKHPNDAAVRREAVDAIRNCSPEQAEELLKESDDQGGLGQLYAEAVLGVAGYHYESNDPSGSDPELRATPFAQRASRLLETATDPKLVTAAARSMLRTGAILWADGKLDWDYTTVGNHLLEGAKKVAPHDFTLMTLPTELPARGERPPATIRVGGNVQQSRLVRQPAPRYPAEARANGIEGTVRFEVLIGLDGRIVYLHVMKGPDMLVDSARTAVSQWQYQPTLLNGKPCYVITLIDVNYTLGR